MVCSSCDGPQTRDGYITPAIQGGQEKGPAGCASRRAPSERTRASGDGPYRGCLEPLVALGDLELHPLPLGQRLVAVHGDLGVVHEQVVTVFPFDEAVPLLVAEPLHGPLRHSDTLLRKNLVLALRPTEPPMRRRTHALSLHHASGAVNERLHSAVPGNSRRRISSHGPNRDSSSTPSGSRSRHQLRGEPGPLQPRRAHRGTAVQLPDLAHAAAGRDHLRADGQGARASRRDARRRARARQSGGAGRALRRVRAARRRDHQSEKPVLYQIFLVPFLARFSHFLVLGSWSMRARTSSATCLILAFWSSLRASTLPTCSFTRSRFVVPVYQKPQSSANRRAT